MRLTLLVLCITSIVYGQDLKGPKNNDSERIDWLQPLKEKISEENTKQFLYFTGAINDVTDSFLPRYYKQVSVNNSQGVEAELLNQVFEPASNEEAAIISSSILSSSIKVRTDLVTSKKHQSAMISFIPLRKNPANGKIEKLISFDLRISHSQGSKISESRSPLYAANSVLQNGDWYKLAVAADGIYKLSYSFLQNIGLNLSTIDPRNIRIYGNGGKMLPELNSMSRADDLVENAIYVDGENDGIFNSTDYVLFYGQGPDNWIYNPSACPKFSHKKNIYSDSSYYFISVDLGPGKRIQTQASSSSVPTNTVNKSDDRAFYEKNEVSLIRSGKEWYGEHFDITTSYNFPFSFPGIDMSSPVTVNAKIASRYVDMAGFSNSQYTVSCQSASTSISIPEVTGSTYDDYANVDNECFSFSPNNSSLIINITKQTPDAIGWLDFIEVNARRSLTMYGDQMTFRDAASIGSGNISAFNLTSSTPVQIWDISDPANIRNQILVNSGSGYQFTLATDSLKEFIAFNGSTYYTPSITGKVTNQDLHSLSNKDLIIISAPDFYNEALNLASHHTTKDSLSTIVVTPQQIYNEFSSGSQDVSALRDFVKMFYDKAGSTNDIPKYLILLGDASFDYKNRISNNTNFVPTYETDNSTNVLNSICTDDFFGLLDNNEGLWNFSEAIDIGIGRIPAKTIQEAASAVNKIILYTQTGIIAPAEPEACSADMPPNPFGDWRNNICFVGDDEGNNLHIVQANTLATNIDNAYNNLNIDKIYLDAYTQVLIPPYGQRYPDVNIAIDQRVSKGCLILNFTGHGGPTGWAHERILEISHINSWNNRDKLFFLYGATADFSCFDDPGRNSGGEYAFSNSNGGAIAVISGNRVTYASPNFTLNQNFYNAVFTPVNGKMPRLGDIYHAFKTMPGGNSFNSRSFNLLGDPSLTLAYPKYIIATDSINGISALSTDTIGALSFVTVKGHIKDKNGVMLNNYNGVVYPTVFDKKINVTTLSNDGTTNSPPYTFKQQTNILFKGRASVVNGTFSFSFVIPKSIDSTYGIGRISYYAENGTEDASGWYENVIIGGMNANAVTDNSGPQISLYMNDTKFANGGITDENPDLFALLTDEHGINTFNDSHALRAVLDANTSGSIVLNDYYRSNMNSYKKGSVRYPFNELSEGTHTLELTASDVYNNTSKSHLDFVVAKSAELALSHVLNYPNPFTTRTSFFFEQNQCCQYLQVELQIFSVSGKMVKSFNETIYADGYRSQPVVWDGRDDFGDKIGKGVYVYRLKIKTESGQTAEKYEKLVILN